MGLLERVQNESIARIKVENLLKGNSNSMDLSRDYRAEFVKEKEFYDKAKEKFILAREKAYQSVSLEEKPSEVLKGVDKLTIDVMCSVGQLIEYAMHVESAMLQSSRIDSSITTPLQSRLTKEWGEVSEIITVMHHISAKTVIIGVRKIKETVFKTGEHKRTHAQMKEAKNKLKRIEEEARQEVRTLLKQTL